jgi:hypothetical protein
MIKKVRQKVKFFLKILCGIQKDTYICNVFNTKGMSALPLES